MYESSTDVIPINMVSSFLPAFCLLLVVGAAIADKDEIPKEMMEKMKAIHDACVEEGHDAPTEMTKEVKPEYACYYKCLMKKMGLYKDGKVTMPEQFPNHKDVQKCIDENNTSDDGCNIALVSQKCMKEFGPQ